MAGRSPIDEESLGHSEASAFITGDVHGQRRERAQLEESGNGKGRHSSSKMMPYLWSLMLFAVMVGLMAFLTVGGTSEGKERA